MFLIDLFSAILLRSSILSWRSFSIFGRSTLVTFIWAWSLWSLSFVFICQSKRDSSPAMMEVIEWEIAWVTQGGIFFQDPGSSPRKGWDLIRYFLVLYKSVSLVGIIEMEDEARWTPGGLLIIVVFIIFLKLSSISI